MNVLLVGLGSPNRGDDQVGLLAAARLRAILPPAVEVTTDTTGGSRLIALTEGVDTLILLDALAASPSRAVGTHARWRYPEDRHLFDQAIFRGTHSISVIQGLDLAEALGRLPFRVLIHALAVARFEPGAPLSPELEDPLRRWIQIIYEEALGQCASPLHASVTPGQRLP